MVASPRDASNFRHGSKRERASLTLDERERGGHLEG